jgi:hypothetical protein
LKNIDYERDCGGTCAIEGSCSVQVAVGGHGNARSCRYSIDEVAERAEGHYGSSKACEHDGEREREVVCEGLFEMIM